MGTVVKVIPIFVLHFLLYSPPFTLLPLTSYILAALAVRHGILTSATICCLEEAYLAKALCTKYKCLKLSGVQRWCDDAFSVESIT